MEEQGNNYQQILENSKKLTQVLWNSYNSDSMSFIQEGVRDNFMKQIDNLDHNFTQNIESMNISWIDRSLLLIMFRCVIQYGIMLGMISVMLTPKAQNKQP